MMQTKDQLFERIVGLFLRMNRQRGAYNDLQVFIACGHSNIAHRSADS